MKSAVTNQKEVLEKKAVKKKKKGLLITVVIMIVLDLFACVFLFFAYGPVSYFRDLLITTAMTTKSHKYLAHILYSDKTIQRVIDENYVVDIEENTNVDDIKIGSSNGITEYESVYEQQILTKEPGNNLYKMIPIEGKGYKGYLVAIYDPSRIHLMKSRYYGYWGQTLEDLSKKNQVKVGMNASGFADTNLTGNGAVVTGIYIQDGKIIDGPVNKKEKIIGFNQNHVLVLMEATANEALKSGVRDAVSFGPFLIVNGKAAEIKGNGGWGISARTAIAQRKDGIVLFLVIDGRQPGYSMGTDMKEMVKILLRYKAYNAANLDGGASSSLNIEGKLVSKPCAVNPKGERPIPNAWVVK